MSTLLMWLESMLNKEQRAKFVSGGMKQTFCDFQTPFNEMDRLSFELLTTRKSPPFSWNCPRSRGNGALHRPLWDFDEILDNAFNSNERTHELDSILIDISKWLRRDTWHNYTKSAWNFIGEVRWFITRLEKVLDFIKSLACAAVLSLVKLPKQVGAVSRYIKDNFLHATEGDFTLLKNNTDHAYKVYSGPGSWVLDEDYMRSIHDSLYNTAKWCAFLPSAMHVYSVHQTSIRQVSSGGFADVYKGEMIDGQVVALKVPRNFGTPDQIRKLHAGVCKEALLWSLSRHENILPLLNVIAVDSTTDAPGPIVLITPWMSNGSLNRYLANNLRADKYKIAEGIVDGLRFLHEERNPSVVHGDLRCDNILVDDEGNPQIADFGLSRVEAMQATLTGTSEARGSLRWQAPELLLPDTYGGDGKHTKETDIYAFGMTLFEIYTGKIPFHELSDAQAILAISQGKKPNRPDVDEYELPDWMWEMMEDCWETDRSKRPTAKYLWFVG